MEVGRRRGVPDWLRNASEWCWRLGLVVVAAAAAIWLLAKVFVVVVVVAISLLLTALLHPAAERLRRHGWRSGWATLLVVGTFLCLLFGGLALLAPQVVDELDKVGEQAAQGVREAERWLRDGPLNLSDRQVSRAADEVTGQLQGPDAARGVLTGAQAVGQVLAGLALTIVITVFLVRDGRQIWGWFVGLLPSHRRERAQQLGQVAWGTLGGYIRGIALVGLVDALLIGLALFALDVPLVLPLMLLTFLGAFIPIAGATVAGLVAALVALVDQGIVTALIVLGIIVAVQQVESNVLYPVVMRRALEVHPVAILVAVAAGALLMGVFGAVIAAPLVAIAARWIEIARAERDHAEEIEGDPPVGPQGVLLGAQPGFARPEELRG